VLSFFSTSFAAVLATPSQVSTAARRARRSTSRTTRTLRLVQLLVGLTGVAVGVALIVTAGLGVASWDIVNVALTDLLGIPFGATVALTGLLCAGIAALLGQRPNLGTLMPLAIVSPILGVVMGIIETPASVSGQLAMLLTGMVVMALGVGSYVGADHGAGPSDLVFLGLSRKGLPVWAARLTVDGVAGTVGFLLGGPIGAGTIIITVGMGPLVGLAIRAFDLSPARDQASLRSLRLSELWANDPAEDLPHGIGPVLAR
jgi:uncharacterized protein